MLKLFCVVVGEGRPFPVDIAAAETVGDLKEKIKEKIKYDGRADALQLYRVDGLAQLGKIRFDFNGAEIDDMPAKLLSDFGGSTTEMVETFSLSSYPQLNDSSVGRIHVLVVVPEGAILQGARPLKKRKIHELADQLPAPSSFAKCRGKTGWIYWLKKLDGQIECHRISNETSLVPLVLLHEVFAIFERNCSTIDFGKPDCDFVVEFCNAMSNGYESEAELAEKARTMLDCYLLSDCPDGSRIAPSVVMNSITDGSYIFGERILLNLEVKIQKGEGGGDPTMQNIAYYIKNLPKNLKQAMPCFLLDICGPLLSVFGIVNVGDEYVLCEPLVSSIPLIFFDNLGLMTMLVRVCASLKAALQELTSSSYAVSDVERCKFPYHDSAMIDGMKIDISYKESILRYVFAATIVQSGSEVIVKFAKRYGRHVQEFCAAEGFAPRLLHYEVLSSNWIFVVIEKLEMVPIAKAPVEAAIVREQVLKIRNRLADAGFVHGDLREANILWDCINNRVVLIDFDWSGKEGEVLYPPFMNSYIHWPEGAETNKPLRRQHDAAWIESLLLNLVKYLS